MPPKSKHYDTQQLLYSHFNGDRNIIVTAVLIYLEKYDAITYDLLIDRFKHNYTFNMLSEKYCYQVSHIQRMINNKIYKITDEIAYIFERLPKN